MNTITDYFQQPLAVGDTIVYPVASGSSSATLSVAKIDRIDELIPNDPSDPECRRGTKYAQRHQPFAERIQYELMMKYDPTRTFVYNGRTHKGGYVYDPTKLFKLRVLTYNDFRREWMTKPSWIKNVDRVIRAPESEQS